jgi:hypothetical protein
LRESETAWDAIKFYGPIGITIGVYIPVSTLAGAISLASDLRYFLRKFTTDHLFQVGPGVYCTSALTRSRYLTRECEFSNEWPYRLVYWIENMGPVIKCRKEEWNREEVFNPVHSGQTRELREDDGAENSIESDPVTLAIHREGFADEPGNEFKGGYLLEVWCTKIEYEMV